MQMEFKMADLGRDYFMWNMLIPKFYKPLVFSDIDCANVCSVL